MTLNHFFAELRRRNVYRAAVGYAAIAWLLIQVATQTLPFFDTPAWVVRLIIIALPAGFPFAMIWAWMFDWTPRGFVRTDEVSPSHSRARSTGRKFDFIIISVLALAIALLVFDRYRHPRVKEEAGIPAKSIAVLPFANLSSDKENAYFADGIQDEILTRLSKIADLKVISRTSTQHYKSAPENLPEIARQLGVAHIVEGSVQKNGDAVRVNVQLITAATDSHLWADTFDRKLTDIFSVESEVAKTIADQLKAKLTSQEERVIASKLTDNPDAYNAYLRGRALAADLLFDKPTVERAVQSYQTAVKLDPSFALAWARLSCVLSSSYWVGLDRSPARLAAAKNAADRAHGLNPDLAETHLALGYYSYYGERDFTGALAEFQVAEKSLPNNADVLVAMGHIKRRLARWEEAIAAQRRVIELDPRDSSAYITLTTTYRAVRRFPEALATIDRVLAWEPANLLALFYKAQIFWANGDVPAAERLLANSGAAPELLGRQALFQRSYTTAITLFSRAVATEKERGESSEDEQLLLGLSQQRAGDVAAARATYEEAVRMLQHELANVLPDSGPGASLHAALGLAYAGLGDAVSAVSEGQKAMAMDPTSKNPFEGPAQEENLARIHAILGDADHAIPILERLLRTAYGGAMTPALLRIDPMFDPIRPDPRFQKLISDGEAAMKAQTKP